MIKPKKKKDALESLYLEYSGVLQEAQDKWRVYFGETTWDAFELLSETKKLRSLIKLFSELSLHRHQQNWNDTYLGDLPETWEEAA